MISGKMINAISAASEAWEICGGDAIQTLADRETIPYKQALRRIEKAVRAGYLEYGTSPRKCWLTEAGKVAIAHPGDGPCQAR